MDVALEACKIATVRIELPHQHPAIASPRRGNNYCAPGGGARVGAFLARHSGMSTLQRDSKAGRAKPDPAQVVARIRAEFEALPGLSLTLPQAARLWHLDRAVCEQAMATLVQDGVLSSSRGQYQRKAN